MQNKKIIYLDFEVDKLINSIENAISGEVFDTLVVKLKPTEGIGIKKGEWAFNWQRELTAKTKQVYKLTTINNPTIIHGLISLTDKGDHIFMDLMKVQNLIKERTNFIKVLPETLLLLVAKCRLN